MLTLETDITQELCGLGIAMCDIPYKMMQAKQTAPMDTSEDITLWQLAVDKSPSACCFMSLEGGFMHVNKAWCVMLGYSESELKQKCWPDITLRQDHGGDAAEVEAIVRGEKDEYYVEKTYIRKDATHLMVGLYVHRYPTAGGQLGYVVFAKPKTANQTEYNELKLRFQEMERNVLLFQHTEKATAMLADKMEQQAKEIRENRELFLNTLRHNDGHINIGDSFANQGHKGHHNDTRVFLYVGAAFAALVTGLITVAVVVAWVAYYGNGGGQDPPNIPQPTVVQPVG